MASPALAVLAAFASRRSLFFFRARTFLPDIALEEWMVCVRVGCARRCASANSWTIRKVTFFKQPLFPLDTTLRTPPPQNLFGRIRSRYGGIHSPALASVVQPPKVRPRHQAPWIPTQIADSKPTIRFTLRSSRMAPASTDTTNPMINVNLSALSTKMHMRLADKMKTMSVETAEGVRYADAKPHTPGELNDQSPLNQIFMQRTHGQDDGVDTPTNPKSQHAKGYIARQRVSISGLRSALSLNGKRSWSGPTPNNAGPLTSMRGRT